MSSETGAGMEANALPNRLKVSEHLKLTFSGTWDCLYSSNNGFYIRIRLTLSLSSPNWDHCFHCVKTRFTWSSKHAFSLLSLQ